MTLVTYPQAHFIAVIIGGGPVWEMNLRDGNGRNETRTAKQDLDVVIRRRQMRRDLILTDKADTASPACRGVVQDVEDLEPGGVLGGELVELLLQQDVFFIHVGVDEAELRAVGGVFQGGTDNLEHRSDTSAPGDHAQLARELRRISELAPRTFDTDLVSEFEQRHVTRDVTLLIGLCTEVNASYTALRLRHIP